MQVSEHGGRLDALESATSGLSDLAGYLDINTTDDSVKFVVANVYIQSGAGSTEAAVNGLGNLIVGYDEDSSDDKSGSHNVGAEHSYTSYGGVISGFNNEISGKYSNITGGRGGIASGGYAMFGGGYLNSAIGEYVAIGGGRENTASGDYAASSPAAARTLLTTISPRSLVVKGAASATV